MILAALPLAFPLYATAAQECADDACLGLPTVRMPLDNPLTPAKIVLGRTLFFDKRLSSDGKTACASCHDPEQAFADGLPLARGTWQRIGTRNAPTLVNAAFNASFFWDGRQATLEKQALDPLVNPREHGLNDLQALVAQLRQDGGYQKQFMAAFAVAPDAIRPEHAGQALAAFQRTLIAGNSAFDRYQYRGERNSLSASAERGLALFKGRAQCATCHVIGEKNAPFTDERFHRLNLGLSAINQRLPEITTRLVEASKQQRNLDQTIISDEEVAELGRFSVTLKPSDIGKFRTPSLRNVALTAPYMHDGSIATLEEAVEWEVYYRYGEGDKPLALTLDERNDLVAFLKALTSASLPQIDHDRH